ncbi:hypothetical protein CHS0354_001566 [Potamilus streckersoni]|uniref:DUF19 domain-containing protein n=1 Tax=Potamilus streckersoni TaxID=2493646 RepID=A0AAE0SI65_9BIVA|nr:hypothetical protein CHS0354_001566 [Potamilus streckersoni]
MWGFVFLTAFIFTVQAQTQSPLSSCVQQFDAAFRKCFKNNGGYQFEIIISLVTNGSSGSLPFNMNRQNVAQAVCGNRQNIIDCISPLISQTPQQCQQMEVSSINNTIRSTVQGIGAMCSDTSMDTVQAQSQPTKSPCVQQFDGPFRKCFEENTGYQFEIIMSVVTNGSSGPLSQNIDQQNIVQAVCGNSQNIINCIYPLPSQAPQQCQQMEVNKINNTVLSTVQSLGVMCSDTPVNTVQAQIQPPTSQCVQQFDGSFQKCFQDNSGYQLEIIISLVTNGSSGPLPPNMNRQNSTQDVCRSRQKIIDCISPLPSQVPQQCDQMEVGMMAATVSSMMQGLGVMCGDPVQPPVCLKNFDFGVRDCLQKMNLVPEQFFMFLANQTLPQGVSRDQIKSTVCNDQAKDSMISCCTGVISKLQQQCNPQEQVMVGTTLQNMIGAYEGMCTGKYLQPAQCMAHFESGMEVCAKKIFNLPVPTIMMVVRNQKLPPGIDADATKKTICGKWKKAEECGKNVIANSGCARNQLLGVEASFASIMIGIATACGDTSIPGACLLTLQHDFGACFSKVGLDQKAYINNHSESTGALIGANRQDAEVYCSKKHDLFTCMQDFLHKCPGAEQTMSMTGFDIHAMERAVGILCNDIDAYLQGIKCFGKPTEQALVCMNKMASDITTLSTQQLTQKLDMDTFLSDFCSTRVRHVTCDAQAWPTCDPKAVDLKNRFECQLIPTKCLKTHNNEITGICPNTETMPVADIDQKNISDCATNILSSLSSCFQQYQVNPDMFLINITHDRRNFLGDFGKAQNLCSTKGQLFQCMRGVISGCTGARDALAYWGHQQSALEAGVDVICNDLNTYGKSLQCFQNGNVAIQQCVSTTENKMIQLRSNQTNNKLSSDKYFREFCQLRINQLSCDLSAWKATCPQDVMGMKTEFECKLIQDQCRNLQVASIQNICNDETYAKALRQPASGGRSNAIMSDVSSNNSTMATTGPLVNVAGAIPSFK